MELLRQAGDFPNRSVVEYATVDVIIPNGRLPDSLIEPRESLSTKVRLSVTTTKCRLTYGELVLESEDLAKQFVGHLHR